MSNSQNESETIQDAPNHADVATSASDLMAMIENGEAAQAIARIQQLPQRDFVHIFRAAQQLEGALTEYALSWQNAHYWGDGESWPDEEKAQAAAA